MTIVFVHGVPEDMHVWDDLRAELPDVATVALSLPGFGVSRPENFAATKEQYLEWLIVELERLSGPIDLVGHDWGGILTSRLAVTHRHLVRSFVTDVIGFFDPTFAWHPLAKLWATPGAGETIMADQAKKSADQRTVQYTSMGVALPYAQHLAVTDGVRDQCILDLYRSSKELHADWGAGVETIAKPGLFLLGTKDPFADPKRSQPRAEQLGLEVALLADLGHFWPSQGPKLAAETLRTFWSRLG